MVGDSCTVLQTLTDSSTNGAQNKKFKKVEGHNSCGLLLCSLNALKDLPVSDT